MLNQFVRGLAQLRKTPLLAPRRSLAAAQQQFQQPRVEVDDKQRLLRIDHHAKDDGVYPNVWLRDNCRCPDCYHEPTGQRRLLIRHLDTSPSIQSHEVGADEKELHITWDDGHRSVYDLSWLLQRSFTPEAITQRERDPAKPRHKTFGPDFVPVQIDFEEAMNDERQLLRFLYHLKRDGLVLLNDTDEQRGLERLCEAMSFVQETQYGKYYDVLVKNDVTNLAYTAETLGLHSDLPYMRHLPGFQVLQCIQQTGDVSGGENLIADCRHVGRLLKEREPEAFHLLTTQKVRYWTKGFGHLKDYHMVCEHPVLKMDEEGEVAEIVYSDAIRDSLQFMDPLLTEKWYKSLRYLHDLMMEESFIHKLNSGQTMVFDNRRTVHGRNGYSLDSSLAVRHLRGCYIPLDETESRLRRLVEKYGEIDTGSERL